MWATKPSKVYRKIRTSEIVEVKVEITELGSSSQHDEYDIVSGIVEGKLTSGETIILGSYPDHNNGEYRCKVEAETTRISDEALGEDWLHLPVVENLGVWLGEEVLVGALGDGL